MAKHAEGNEPSVGRSIAVPLAILGVITLVIGAVRMASGEDGTFVVLFAGVFFLVGAATRPSPARCWDSRTGSTPLRVALRSPCAFNGGST